MNKIITTILLFHNLLLFSQSDSLDMKLLSSLPDETEIAIGIYNKGDIQKYGWINVKNQLFSKENSHNLFELGSITKVFTTITALSIMQKHDLDLNSAALEYYPDDELRKNDVTTFKHLMTHTSGLPKLPSNFIWSVVRCPSDPFYHYCEKRMTRYLKNISFSSNEEFQYSNTGMGLLGTLISEIEKTSLDTLMSEEVFENIKMPSTSLGISENQYGNVTGNLGSTKKPKGIWKFSDATAGAGNLYSNIDDLTKFLQFIFQTDPQNDILQLILKMEEEQVLINKNERMGLGLRIFKNNSTIYYHGGITKGFKSLLAYNRNKEKAIVILTNARGLSRQENIILRKICFEYLN